MSSKRERRRSKKRNDDLRRQASDAVERGKLDDALHLIQLAVQRAPANARYWYDQGKIQLGRGERAAASRSFWSAVERSPSYAAALRELVELSTSDNDTSGTVDLLRRLVAVDPEDENARARLLALVGDEVALAVVDEADPVTDAPSLERTSRYDWNEIETELTSKGCCLLPRLLKRSECAAAIEFDEQPELFEAEAPVTEDGALEGDDSVENGPAPGERRPRAAVYRYLRRPLPPLVEELRAELYWRLAPIANRWEAELDGRVFPRSLDRFLDECHAAGQLRSTPLFFRYDEGESNEPHRDLAGALFFPLQLAVTLGPGNAKDGGGGEFVLSDVGARKRKSVRELRPGIGDAVLFCARDRMRRVGGVLGRQPVLHGVKRLRAERRFALGIPLHDYR